MTVCFASIAVLLCTLSKSSQVRAASFITTSSASYSAHNRHGFSSSSSDNKTPLEMSSDNIESPSLPPIPPMKKRLFLVRHGEVINPGGDRSVYYGAMDVPLSNLGELEAKVSERCPLFLLAIRS